MISVFGNILTKLLDKMTLKALIIHSLLFLFLIKIFN